MTTKIVKKSKNLAELMHWNRIEEMKAVMRFIEKCNFEELAKIVEEIRCCHDCLFAFDEDTGLFAKIESICLQNETIQMNTEKKKK